MGYVTLTTFIKGNLIQGYSLQCTKIDDSFSLFRDMTDASKFLMGNVKLILDRRTRLRSLKTLTSAPFQIPQTRKMGVIWSD